MEPLSILSVAAAVAQFLDFATGVITDTREAYSSSVGQLRDHVELSKISHDLSSLAHSLSSRMSKLIRDDSSDGAALEVEKETIATLLRLCRESKAINKEIQATIAQLSVKGTTKIELAADSFVVALRRVLSVDKVQRLEHRLDENRKQITMAMLVLSWGQAESLHVTMKQFAQHRKELIEQLSNIDDTTRCYGQQILQLIRPQTESKKQEAREIMTYAIDSQWAPRPSMMTVADTPEHVSIRIREEGIAERIMNSLLFETISHREDTVPKAYWDTFEWVFGDPQCASDGTPLWSDLREWATGRSDSIYWISGKAGAGKSTLTKFLARDERLEGYLREWATDRSNLLMATYYSWNAGNKLQKSHSGLLRTILYQCLQRFPRQLVPKIFPNRWALVKLFSPDTPVPLPDWRPWELLSSFRTLLSLANHGSVDGGVPFKIALIIDGLDEFDDDEDHMSLVELLQEAAAYNNVKICVSSRPLNVFRDAFNQNPMLQLEKLTQTDIERYVHGQFRGSPGFAEQKHLHAVEAEKLLNDVVQKAQGVFLWVSVVVRSLLVSLQEGDKLSDAQATLDSLPEDLDRLFLAIWRRTNPVNNVEGAHYFLLLDVCRGHDLVPYATTFFCGDNDIPVDLEPAMREPSFLSCAISSLSRRLNSRTRGLIEITETTNVWDSRVDYMHRTVKEWVTGNWEMIVSLAEPHFDACLWVLKGEVLRMAMLGDANIESEPGMVCHHLEKLFSVAARADGQLTNTATLVHVLDKLDATLTAPFEWGSKQRAPPSRPKRATAHWSNHLHKYKAWLPRRRLHARGWETHDFVRLMAQIPVPQYIKYKLREDAAVCMTDPATVPLLVSAVMGGCQENPETWHPRDRTMTERLDFICAVLSHVSLEEAQKTLAFMCEDLFFGRSWDAEFIAAVKDVLKIRLCAEGLTLVEVSTASQAFSEDTLVFDDALHGWGPPAKKSIALSQASARPKRSLRRRVKTLLLRWIST